MREEWENSLFWEVISCLQLREKAFQLLHSKAHVFVKTHSTVLWSEALLHLSDVEVLAFIVRWVFQAFLGFSGMVLQLENINPWELFRIEKTICQMQVLEFRVLSIFPDLMWGVLSYSFTPPPPKKTKDIFSSLSLLVLRIRGVWVSF